MHAGVKQLGEGRGLGSSEGGNDESKWHVFQARWLRERGGAAATVGAGVQAAAFWRQRLLGVAAGAILRDPRGGGGQMRAFFPFCL